jgi:3-hydroxyacyl-[acyl-carrier-protein] dehydratase
MRFNLVDQILEVEPGRRIRTLKNLTLAEEYLADHFPGFPVMPGVLMLQSVVEAGAWLIRVTDDFKHSIIALREVKFVKYGQFMEPGKQMIVTVDQETAAGDLVTLKGKGEAEGKQTVSARIVLSRYNLGERVPARRASDDRIIAHMRQLYAQLRVSESKDLARA